MGIRYSKLIRYETPERRDTLLPIEHLVPPIGRAVEIDKPYGVALEQRVHHRHVPFAIVIDVVPLVLRLDGELPVQPVEPPLLQLVVNKPLAYIRHRPLRVQLRFHDAFPF